MFTDIKAEIIAFASKEILTLTIDETNILQGSIRYLIKQFKSGLDPEKAFTAALNEFYHSELSEADKIATAFLKFISNTVHHLV